MSKYVTYIVAQKPHKKQPPDGDGKQFPQRRSPQFEQPELFHFFGEKPQISSIPGISPKQRDRYRVLLGNEILGDRLNINEALELAKGGEA